MPADRLKSRKVIEAEISPAIAEPANLTPSQRLFVEELLADPDFNLRQAAIKAGYKNPVQSVNRLMANEDIRKYLGKLIYQRGLRNGIDAERVFQELMKIGLSNIQDTVDEAGKPIPLKQLPRAVAACISSFKLRRTIDEDGTEHEEWEYKLWDKMNALDQLARHLGLIEDLAPVTNVNVFNWKDLLDALANPPPDPLQKRLNALPPAPQNGNEG